MIDRDRLPGKTCERVALDAFNASEELEEDIE